MARAVRNDIDEGGLAVVLDGGVGNEGDALQGVDEQARVDELVREERAVGVGEESAQLDGAGGGVDLVVDGEELAGGELGGLGAVQASTGSVCMARMRDCTWPRLSSANGEDDGDGLHLGDDGQHGVWRTPAPRCRDRRGADRRGP